MSMQYIRAAAHDALSAETKGGAALVNVLCALADNASLPDAPEGLAFEDKRHSAPVPFNVKAFGKYRARPDSLRGFAVWSALNIMAQADRAALIRLDSASRALTAARAGDNGPLVEYLESEARAADGIGADATAARIRGDIGRIGAGANDAPAIAEAYATQAALAVRLSKKENGKEARRRILYRAWTAGLGVWRQYSESIRNTFESAEEPMARRAAVAAWLQGEAGGVTMADAERLVTKPATSPALSGDLATLKRACDAMDKVPDAQWSALGEYATLRAQAAAAADVDKKTALLDRAAAIRARLFPAPEAPSIDGVF